MQTARIIPGSSVRRGTAPILSVLCAFLVGAFYLMTIRAGQEWGDDFSMYIHHAENIVHGIPYTETGYIYNPHNPSVGPRLYPPGFPVLLAPLVKVFGLDLEPMKVELILFFVGSLLVLTPLFRDVLPPAYQPLLVLLMGLNPYFWGVKEQVLSDLPFLFFLLVSLCLFLRGGVPNLSTRRRVVYAVLAGLAAYASYATRTVGIVLLPSFLVHDLIRYRRITVFGWVASAVLVVLAGAQYLFWVHDSSYLDQLKVTPAIVRDNVVFYLRSLSELWENGYSESVRRTVFLGLAALAVCGYVTRVRAGPGLLEVFPWFYLCTIFAWPSSQGTRFLIPVTPFCMSYCLIGIRWVDSAIRQRWGRTHVLLFGSLATFVVTYAGRYSTLSYGPLRQGIADPETLEMFAFVRTATHPSDVFIFSKPRALSLFTARTASAPYSPADPRLLWRYMADVHASYVITGPDALEPDVTYLQRFVDQYRGDFQLLLANRELSVYRIARNPCVPAPRDTTACPGVLADSHRLPAGPRLTTRDRTSHRRDAVAPVLRRRLRRENHPLAGQSRQDRV